MKKRVESTLILTPNLPDSYCSPIVGINVVIRQTEVPIPHNKSFSFPSAIRYERYPISNASIMLIIVRKTLTFIFI